MTEVPPQYPAAPAQPLSPADEKLWATLTHVLGIFFAFIPSLIVYLVLKDRGPFVREHSKAALNFQIVMTIADIVGYFLWALFFIGTLVNLAVFIVRVIFSIQAAIAANKGELYKYPLSGSFVK